MRLPVVVRKALASLAFPARSIGGGGWLVRESFGGAWQRGITVDRGSVLAFHAVYSCATLIASDIAKLRVKLVQQDDAGIWQETTSPAFSPVLRKPNPFQTRIQFWESWMLSKLLSGNAYVLKVRDSRSVVVGLYVLDPSRVAPLVTADGDVYYQLRADNLAGIADSVTVPARDIIHDRWNFLFHPLCGMSPIYAAGLAATQGLRIQTNSTRFFGNDSRPGGILTSPGRIDDAAAKRLKSEWESQYSGDNLGKLAILGGGLKYEPIAMTAEASQLIEQLRWTAEVVCSTFHVPPYKIGVGQMPTYNNIQALNVEYYSQCLQKLIEDAEACLDEGLGLGTGSAASYGTEFDVDNLLRMDSVTQMTVLKEGVGAAVLSPNEARRKVDLPPVKGGDSPLAQQQNYSLEALAKRDAKDDPFATSAPKPPAAPNPPADSPPPDAAAAGRAIDSLIERHFALLRAA